MNKRGFTLVEVIVVISLLGLVLIISSTSILSGQKRAKEKMLETKIRNIEKAAVLYGQDYRYLISKKIDNTEQNKNDYPLCFKDQSDGSKKHITNCYYYFDNKNNEDPNDDTTLITVGDLAKTTDVEGKSIEPYINYDEGTDIVNPMDKESTMNDCEIQIYQKYGKIYAVYTKVTGSVTENTKCWVD